MDINSTAVGELTTSPLPQYANGITIPAMMTEIIPLTWLQEHNIQIGKNFDSFPLRAPLYDDAITEKLFIPEKLRVNTQTPL